MRQVAARYRNFYSRKVNRPIPGPDEETLEEPELVARGSAG
jgi:hypothetical protein